MGKTDRKKKEARAAAANCAVCTNHKARQVVFTTVQENSETGRKTYKRIPVPVQNHRCQDHQMTGPLAF